jgi:hypothetical protein
MEGATRPFEPERKTIVTAKDKIARRKRSLLDLAADLSDVSRARKVMGCSRRQFYEIGRNFRAHGAEGLIDRLPGAKGPHPNRVSAEIERAVLDRALVHPCHRAVRVEQCCASRTLIECESQSTAAGKQVNECE